MFKFTSLIFIFLLSFQASEIQAQVIDNNQVFRDEVIAFIRQYAAYRVTHSALPNAKRLDNHWQQYYLKRHWTVDLSLYYHGRIIAKSAYAAKNLSQTLAIATDQLLGHVDVLKIDGEILSQSRFKVLFHYYPAKTYSFIEYKAQGLELSGSRVVVRKLSTHDIKQQIEASHAYLLRVMHPNLKGFYKFYNAGLDSHQNQLRTIYSASTLYTFFKLYGLTHEASVLAQAKEIADFILARQIIDGPNAGGFYYGFYAHSNKTNQTAVVGTCAKTIFTLILLNDYFKNDAKYLVAARKAGDWLLTRINLDGSVRAKAIYRDGVWHDSNKQSMLYSGQVLSALSRLFLLTHDQRYYLAAAKIAKYFSREIKKQGLLLGDDYRPANVISTSWALMSLMDFSKINQDSYYLHLTQKLAQTILARQIHAPADIFNDGRYYDSMTTSGNGWINEVMGVWYPFCQQAHLNHCNDALNAMIDSSRWLLQNAYTAESVYDVKNPSYALGAFILDWYSQNVRTDAVCHGVNSLVSLLEIMGPHKQGLLIERPEPPLVQVLPLIEKGVSEQ